MPVELTTAAEFATNATLNSAINDLVAARADAGFFFDFDGVLSRIADDPESVNPIDGVADVLTELGARIGHIALLSSRNAEFLRSRLGHVPGLGIHGLYGLEHVDSTGEVVIEPPARKWITVAHELWENAVRDLPDVYVEDKKLSVGLHYRLVPHLRESVELWATNAAARTGFRPQPGRMAVELKPPLDADKGTTLTRLTADLRAAWYFGDDLGDLPAFAALRERIAADGEFRGLAVGIGNDTIVDDVRKSADVFVASPDLLVEMLRYVRDRLDLRGDD